MLFVSPYPICPPTHGGGVFMYQTCMELARLCDLAPARASRFREPARAACGARVAMCVSGVPGARDRTLAHLRIDAPARRRRVR